MTSDEVEQLIGGLDHDLIEAFADAQLLTVETTLSLMREILPVVEADAYGPDGFAGHLRSVVTRETKLRFL